LPFNHQRLKSAGSPSVILNLGPTCNGNGPEGWGRPDYRAVPSSNRQSLLLMKFPGGYSKSHSPKQVNPSFLQSALEGLLFTDG
jgi:hypothetical protein